MNNREYAFVASEVTELKRLLSCIPADNVLERIGLEHRLAQAEEALRQMHAVAVPETIIMTFKGKPVRGTHGIYADFATKVIAKLSEAFAAFVANAKGIAIGGGGVIPEIDKHKLLITGTALGSFGFELELPTPDPNPGPVQCSMLPKDDLDEAPILKARDMLGNVLTQSLEGDDDQLAESLEGIDVRTLTKVQELYDILRQDEAVFSLTIGHRKIVCPTVEKAQQAAARLKSDNIVVAKAHFTGKLAGVLTQKRDFEFINSENVVIRGKIDKTVEDTSILIREWFGKPASIRLASRTVGKGRPRYTLMSLDDIAPTETEASHG